MKGLLTQFFKAFSSKNSGSDKPLKEAITNLTGFTPRNIDLYKLATRHSSAANKAKEHNERLEYLGDAILGAVIAEFLFKKFPYKEEGFLTEIRSRIVNGEHLSALARKIGLSALIDHDKRQKGGQLNRSSMHGDAMEALVAAVFLDHGFIKCKEFIIKKLINSHVHLDAIVEQNINYKSQLIEWAQRKNRKVAFEIVNESGASHYKEFLAEVKIDGELAGSGKGLSKKKAEQAAAEKALVWIAGQ